MDSFGQKLREAIESRGLSLEYVARATGIDIVHLRALERDDLGALPEDESLTEGLQAIARLVDVEPDEVVNDFLRERQQHRHTEVIQPDDEFVRDAQQQADVVIREPASRSNQSTGLFVLVGAALALAVAGFMWLWPSGTDETVPTSAVSGSEIPTVPADGASPGEVPTAPENALESSGVQAAPAGETASSAGQGSVPDGNPPVSMGQSQEAMGQSQDAVARTPETTELSAAVGTPEPTAPTESATPITAVAPTESAAQASAAPAEPVHPPPAAVQAAAASGLAIPQHGVGTGVVNHALIGEAERFAEGTRVWFWTWVNGATSGETIQHVWLHEGREMLSVPLKLGGARWRTQSYKNLHPGSTGQWRVEARDEAGSVLARRDFQCFGSATD